MTFGRRFALGSPEVVLSNQQLSNTPDFAGKLGNGLASKGCVIDAPKETAGGNPLRQRSFYVGVPL